MRGKDTSINWRNGYKRGEEGKKEEKEMRKGKEEGKGTGMQGFGKEGEGGIGGKGNDIRHGRKE